MNIVFVQKSNGCPSAVHVREATQRSFEALVKYSEEPW